MKQAPIESQSDPTLVPSAGFGLIELMFAVGILSFVVMATMSLHLMLQKSQIESASLFQLTVTAQNFMTLVNNEQAWTNTISANANAMKCLAARTPCTVGGQANGKALTNVPFAIFDAAGKQPIYDATNPASGFTMSGVPCSLFSAQGNDSCPIRYNLTWSAICTNGNCVKPQVLVSATFVYAPRTSRIVLNPANYSMPAVYRAAQ